MNMNLFYKNYVPRIATAILLVCAGQLFTGCSKDKADDLPGEGAKLDGKISVKVMGIEEGEGISLSSPKASAVNRSGAQAAKGSTAAKMVSFSAFDAVVSVEKEVLNQTNLVGDVSRKSASPELLAAAMAPDVKYRLLLYKKDGTFVSSTLLTSGTAGQVDVAKGTGYDWYAISYNNTENVPDVDPTTPTLALPGGKDVLYASGEVIIPAEGPDGNTALGVTFKHKLARIGVELNTKGMFADINTAAITVTGLVVKTGTLNLKTGALTNLVDVPQTIDYSSFADVEAPYHDAKIAYVYTADGTTAATLTVSLTNLALNLDDNVTVRKFDALATTPSVFTFNVTPQLGSSYRALVNLVESPLSFGGVRWSRANLYNPGGHNPYRFFHTTKHTNQRNSYFSFRGVSSNDFGVNGDPCAQVYPTGVWRQATEADYRTLVGGLLGIPLAQPVTYGTVGSLGYFEYNTTGTIAPYGSNKLRFNFNGEGIALSLVEGIVQLNFGTTYGETGQIWTASAGLDLLGLGGLGAWHYQGNRSILGNNSSLGAALLNVSAIGIDVIKTNFKNVRCVRSAAI